MWSVEGVGYFFLKRVGGGDCGGDGTLVGRFVAR